MCTSRSKLLHILLLSFFTCKIIVTMFHSVFILKCTRIKINSWDNSCYQVFLSLLGSVIEVFVCDAKTWIKAQKLGQSVRVDPGSNLYPETCADKEKQDARNFICRPWSVVIRVCSSLGSSLALRKLTVCGLNSLVFNPVCHDSVTWQILTWTKRNLGNPSVHCLFNSLKQIKVVDIRAYKVTNIIKYKKPNKHSSRLSPN